LQEWVASGAFAQAWAVLLTAYDDLVGLELTWQAGDGCLTKAPLGRKREAGEALATGSNPTDCGKAGTKRHLLTDSRGIPLSLVISGANRTDMKKLEALLDASLAPYPEAAPAPPDWHLVLDRGYDYPICRQIAQDHHFIAHIPAKASATQPLPPPGDPTRHPARRWVVEVAHSWFNRFRRLLIRWEKKAANYLALLQFAATLIIYRKLRHAQVLSG
jgi:putative transposase